MSLSAFTLDKQKYITACLDMLIVYDDETLGYFFKPLLDIGPAMTTNHNISIEHIKLFHDKTMNQLATQEATFDSIYTAQIDRWGEFSEQLTNLQKAQDKKLEKIEMDLKAHDELQEEEHDTVMEKIDQVLEKQDGLDEMIWNKVLEAENGRKAFEKAFLENMTRMFDNQASCVNTMVMLNDNQQRQSAVAATQLDRLASMEDKIDLLVLTIDSARGDKAVNGAPAELQGDMPIVAGNHAGTAIDASRVTLEQPAEVKTGGTFRPLWESLAPLLIVSLFLTFI